MKSISNHIKMGGHGGSSGDSSSTSEEWSWSSDGGSHHSKHSSSSSSSSEQVIELWVKFFTQFAQKIQEMVSKSDWKSLAQLFVTSSHDQKNTHFPASPKCLQPHGHGRRSSLTLLLNNKDVDWKSVETVDKESTGNGIWFLLLQLALQNKPGQPKPDQETTKNLIVIITENQDKIRTLVKEDKWDELIKLLNTKSEEKNVKVDWTQVFDDKTKGHDLKEVTENLG